MNTTKTFDSLVLDLFPELNRAAIGFEPTLRRLYNTNHTSSYPPYNIVSLDDNHYHLELAVAGFARDDIEISLQETQLVISAKKESSDAKYVHRGIANRAFTQKFTLGEHIHVTDASIENGILLVKLERVVPENKQPKLIPIKDVRQDAIDVTATAKIGK